MDEEAKELLREIRNAALRHETSQRRLTGIVVAVIVVILTILGFLTARLEIRMQEAEQSERPAATPATAPEQTASDNEAIRASRQQQIAIENAVVREILVKDLDVLGEWDGDSGNATRAFADVHIIQDKQFKSRGMFQVDFIVETETMATAKTRIANFKDGILTLDEPIDDERGINSGLPISALLAVRTGQGEFLIPVNNAADMKTVNELKPGFAYKRVSGKPVRH